MDVFFSEFTGHNTLEGNIRKKNNLLKIYKNKGNSLHFY